MITEQKLSTGIGRKTAFKLWLHNSVCAYCRYYEKQSKRLDKLLQRFSTDKNIEITNTENLKATIIRRLNNQ